MELKMDYDRRGRYYYNPLSPERKWYSVSTINKWGAARGRASDAAKIGTICHYNILRNYTDEFLEVPTENPYWTTSAEVDQKIDAAMQMWYETHIEDVVKEWLGIEKTVWFNGIIDGVECWYAGKLDIVAKCNDGKIRLIDLKTGDEYDDYLYQLGAYVQALEFCEKIKVDEIWVVYLDIGGNYNKTLNLWIERNIDKIPRIVVWNQEKIKEGIDGFNKKLVAVFSD